MPNSQHHVSPQQLAANRANAAKSPGPRSTEGKRRSSQNARKHGFTATTFTVVKLEDLDEVANLKEDLVAFYQPVNSQELFALERVALAQQATLRAARLEAGFFTTCLSEAYNSEDDGTPLPMNSERPEDIEITKAHNANYLLVHGFRSLVRQTNSFTLVLRYQAQAERQYRRAIEEFDRLKALREELPIEPVSGPPEAQPEQNESPAQADQTKNPIPPDPAPGAPATLVEPNPDHAVDSGLLNVPLLTPPVTEARIPAEPPVLEPLASPTLANDF